MPTTLENQTLEAFRWSNYNSLSSAVSPLLLDYVARQGVFSLDEFIAKPQLDFSLYKALITTADFKGIGVFAPYAESIILPAMNSGIISNQTINLTAFANLKIINQQFNRTGPTDGMSYSPFWGDMSTLTGLTHLAFSMVSAGSYKLPTLSANTGLRVVVLSGTPLNSLITNTNVGNLQNNLLLQEFRLMYFPHATGNRAVIDNILSSLRAAKVAGGAISVIDFTGSPAPTAGASNADAIWLAANGVTVTLGVL